MIKKWLPRLLIGLVILVIGLLVTAPAQVFEQQLTSNVIGLKTQGTSGRLWTGHFSEINYRNIYLKDISWQLSLSSILSASLGIDVKIEDDLFTGMFFVKQGLNNQTTVNNINATMSLFAISELFPQQQFIQPSGELLWEDTAISFNESTYSSASGHIKWPNAEVISYAQSYSLGSLDMELTTDNGRLKLILSSDQTLDLQGFIIIDRQNNYQLDVSVGKSLPPKIYNALRMMARPDDTGRLTFKRSGKF